MGNMDWSNIFQAIISGVFVGLVVFGLDLIRSRRERKLSDFRIAANWETSEHKVSLRSFYLPKANLSGFDLSGVNFESANIRKAGLWSTNLKNANLRKANLRGAQLVGADLQKVVATNANFSKTVIHRHDYSELDCSANFSGARFIGVNFRKSSIKEALFQNTNLKYTDFSGAVIERTDFSYADLTGSKWKKVKRVEKCIWKGVKGATVNNFPTLLLDEIKKQNADV